MKKLFLFLIILVALSCQANSEKSAMYDDAGTPQTESSPPKAPQYKKEESSPIPSTRKIIKTAEVRLQVKNLDSSSKHIQDLVEQFGGFVSNLNMANSNYEWSAQISLKVPAKNFQTLLDSIKKQAIFLNYERIHTDDVTEEYFDIQTRLKTKKEVRDRYIDILRNKAKTVKDILLAEEKIRVVQEEIEAAEGRLKFLSSNVRLSTITVELYQKIEYKPTPNTYSNSFWNRVGRSFKNGLSFFEELTLGLISIWPILLILGLLFGFRKRIFRRFRRNERD
ncbi:MAG TPA: DUF4349 domain-containing protein [Saprospiraceae bacterium]|nr:DUF4349 domain-containing protein [Saprospiraceae bacterium]